MQEDPVAIAGRAHTPTGGFHGVRSRLKATDLVAAAANEAIERADVDSYAVDRI